MVMMMLIMMMMMVMIMVMMVMVMTVRYSHIQNNKTNKKTILVGEQTSSIHKRQDPFR